MKKQAVEAIIKMYEENSHMLKETIEALGQVGGKDAINQIEYIYSKNTHMLKETIKALGEAGKNSNT